MRAPLVLAEGLTKRFGEFTAVDGVSFELGEGGILGYLGPNGSGKTTTLRMLLGLLEPTSGRAELFGIDPGRGSVRQRVGYMSQRSALYDELTVEENLAFYARAYGVDDAARVAEVLDEVELGAVAHTPAGQLPGGWRQRLALASAWVHRPDLLILDEPTSGVDPLSRRAFWDRIYDLARQGVSAIVTTHYMDEAEFCERVGIMARGRLLAIDSPQRLKRSEIRGEVWEVWTEPVVAALEALEQESGVERAGLAADHVRVVTRAGATDADLRRALERRGFAGVRLERGEPTLEDVFLALAAS